mmetsp:Transcript_56113/g.133663  ORF Transcript_56113/g.133663 Transcript_56113/m.133663 type:complete len:201 (-) Transcript_56113:197-799(-)
MWSQSTQVLFSADKNSPNLVLAPQSLLQGARATKKIRHVTVAQHAVVRRLSIKPIVVPTYTQHGQQRRIRRHLSRVALQEVDRSFAGAVSHRPWLVLEEGLAVNSGPYIVGLHLKAIWTPTQCMAATFVCPFPSLPVIRFAKRYGGTLAAFPFASKWKRKGRVRLWSRNRLHHRCDTSICSDMSVKRIPKGSDHFGSGCR